MLAFSVEFFLALPGAHACNNGIPVPKSDCENAGKLLAPNPGRTLQVGSGGTCLDGGWGSVPKGCSVQTGGDRAAHFKTHGDTGHGCIDSGYQLVCKVPGIHFLNY